MRTLLRHGLLGLAIGTAVLGIACGSDDSSSGNGSDAGHDATGPTTDASPANDANPSQNDGASPDGTTDAPSGSDTGADSGGSDAGVDDALGPVEDGGLLVQFVSADETANFAVGQEEKSTGTITFGAANAAASDNAVLELKRTGGSATIGTSGAEEIVSNRSFSFGTFRYRFRLATCASSEEVVSSPFAYFNDGTKAADGLVINREVDIEILCGEPYFINLTIWTEYTDDTHLKNQARVLDTRTGTLYVYANDSQGNETGTEAHPELAIPGFPQAGAFYEMGWTWAPDHLRYFVVIGGQDVTMWDATDATRIPQAPMDQHFNIWAPGDHWSTGTKAGPPANDATFTVDWFRYDPQ
jgi:hypothetical protein